MFALLLVFAGGINLVIGTLELSPAIFRKITAANFGFWLAALVLFAVAHPVVQPIMISATAALLYGLSLSRQGRTARGAG